MASEPGDDRRWVTRHHRAIVAVVFLVALGSDIVATALIDEKPVSLWLVACCALATAFGAGVLIVRLRWVLALIVPAGVVLYASATPINPLVGGLAVIVALPVTIVVMVVGALVGMLAKRGPPVARRIRYPAWAALAAGFVPLPVVGVQAHRTVTAPHTDGRVIVESEGSYRGVRLAAPTARVRAALGPPVSSVHGGHLKVSPTDAAPDRDGPTRVTFGRRDVFLRYPRAAIDVRANGVHWMQITDRSAATSRGVGVGDSMSRVRAAYGRRARCGEDSIGFEDGDVPFPYCVVRAAPNRCVSFFADPTRPGTPVVAVWLTHQDPETPRGLP